jgi:hypothetical protein
MDRISVANRTFMLLALICVGCLMDAEAQRQPGPSAEAIAAARQELESRCAQVAKADAEELEALKKPLSHDAEIALGSVSNLLRFLSDPSTTYLDRMAVVSAKLHPADREPLFGGALIDDALTRRRDATRAAALIGPEELPALWKASAALQETQVVGPYPCYYILSSNLTPRDWITRSNRLPVRASTAPKTFFVFSREVEFPTSLSDYPVTLDDRNQAPWLWQLSRAFPILMRSVESRYSAPDLYPLLGETAWAWQPSNDFEKRTRANALAAGPKNALWVETLVRLIREDPVNYGFTTKLSDFTLFTPYHTEELLYAANMFLLAKTDDERIATESAFQLHRFHENRSDTNFGFPVTVKALKTATAILEVSRWATNPSLNLFNRYAAFAVAVCKMADPAPFDCSKTLAPQSPELIGAMNKFEQWLETQRKPLQKKAEAERPWLDSLLRELHLSIE